MSEKSNLVVYDLTQQQKDFLYDFAQKNLGSSSRTKAIKALINEKMQEQPKQDNIQKPVVNTDENNGKSKKRIQLSLRVSDYNILENITKNTDTSIQYYIISLILKDLYAKQRLLGNEIELLSKSNYELHKVGVNLNQIAKAINQGEAAKLPLKNLIQNVESHIELVKNLLKNSLERY